MHEERRRCAQCEVEFEFAFPRRMERYSASLVAVMSVSCLGLIVSLVLGSPLGTLCTSVLLSASVIGGTPVLKAISDTLPRRSFLKERKFQPRLTR